MILRTLSALCAATALSSHSTVACPAGDGRAAVKFSLSFLDLNRPEKTVAPRDAFAHSASQIRVSEKAEGDEKDSGGNDGDKQGTGPDPDKEKLREIRERAWRTATGKDDGSGDDSGGSDDGGDDEGGQGTSGDPQPVREIRRPWRVATGNGGQGTNPNEGEVDPLGHGTGVNESRDFAARATAGQGTTPDPRSEPRIVVGQQASGQGSATGAGQGTSPSARPGAEVHAESQQAAPPAPAVNTAQPEPKPLAQPPKDPPASGGSAINRNP